MVKKQVNLSKCRKKQLNLGEYRKKTDIFNKYEELDSSRQSEHLLSSLPLIKKTIFENKDQPREVNLFIHSINSHYVIMRRLKNQPYFKEEPDNIVRPENCDKILSTLVSRKDLIESNQKSMKNIKSLNCVKVNKLHSFKTKKVSVITKIQNLGTSLATATKSKILLGDMSHIKQESCDVTELETFGQSSNFKRSKLNENEFQMNHLPNSFKRKFSCPDINTTVKYIEKSLIEKEISFHESSSKKIKLSHSDLTGINKKSTEAVLIESCLKEPQKTTDLGKCANEVSKMSHKKKKKKPKKINKKGKAHLKSENIATNIKMEKNLQEELAENTELQTLVDNISPIKCRLRSSSVIRSKTTDLMSSVKIPNVNEEIFKTSNKMVKTKRKHNLSRKANVKPLPDNVKAISADIQKIKNTLVSDLDVPLTIIPESESNGLERNESRLEVGSFDNTKKYLEGNYDRLIEDNVKTKLLKPNPMFIDKNLIEADTTYSYLNKESETLNLKNCVEIHNFNENFENLNVNEKISNYKHKKFNRNARLNGPIKVLAYDAESIFADLKMINSDASTFVGNNTECFININSETNHVKHEPQSSDVTKLAVFAQSSTFERSKLNESQINHTSEDLKIHYLCPEIDTSFKYTEKSSVEKETSLHKSSCKKLQSYTNSASINEKMIEIGMTQIYMKEEPQKILDPGNCVKDPGADEVFKMAKNSKKIKPKESNTNRKVHIKSLPNSVISTDINVAIGSLAANTEPQILIKDNISPIKCQIQSSGFIKEEIAAPIKSSKIEEKAHRPDFESAFFSEKLNKFLAEEPILKLQFLSPPIPPDSPVLSNEKLKTFLARAKTFEN